MDPTAKDTAATATSSAAATPNVHPVPWTPTQWEEFGVLFQKLSEFFIRYCNDYQDDHESEIRIRDKPFCPPRLRNTVYGKEIWWKWKAADLFRPPRAQRREEDQEEDDGERPTMDSLCLPRRRHWEMLHLFFGWYNLDVKKYDDHYIVCLSRPEPGRFGSHTCINCRTPRPKSKKRSNPTPKETKEEEEEEEEETTDWETTTDEEDMVSEDTYASTSDEG